MQLRRQKSSTLKHSDLCETQSTSWPQGPIGTGKPIIKSPAQEAVLNRHWEQNYPSTTDSH